MSDIILGLDHPVVAVRDMDEARSTYENLGFVVPPRGSHVEWGTGNWCIVFAADYIELRGILDASRYTHRLDTFLAEREGLMGVAFTTSGAAEGYGRLRALGVGAAEPRELTRNFELPEGWVKPRFKIVFIQEEHAPGLMAPLIIEHLTPALIRRADWLEHPNSARSVRAVTAVVDDLVQARAAYIRLFGESQVDEDDGSLTVAVGRGGHINVTTTHGLERLHGTPEFDPMPKTPYLAAMTLEVGDVGRARTVLEKNEVPVEMVGPDLIRVGPGSTCGIVLEFASSNRGTKRIFRNTLDQRSS